MLRKVRKMIRKYRLKERASAKDYIAYLRAKGAEIGEDVNLYDVQRITIDETAPWLLKFGNHINITSGVIILTHDYSWSVLKTMRTQATMPGAVLGAQAPVVIGDHVFIGMNSIILRGVTIGDHVIIGAGSVVSKDCESGSVYAGNPARRIMSVEEFFAKRSACQFEEAKKLAACYRQRFGKQPPMEIFREYFMLFLSEEEAMKVPDFARQMRLMGNFDETAAYMRLNKPMFDGYEAFLAAVADEA